MLHTILLLVPAFVLATQASESYSPISVPSPKRQLMSCEYTYGNGSIPCGGPESTWCYNPGLGQDEDLATCAKNAGFDLPSSAVEHTATSTSTGAVRTFTITPFLASNPKPTVVNALSSGAEGMLKPSTTCHKLPAISTPMVIQVSNASASTPISSPKAASSVVQVSIAAESRAIIRLVAMLAVASIIALL
ncbi:hypothetical protein FHL15_002439 [Xylaria flabelliformis]|uniref:Uncharacterized protein n=1 Tax=Xylaria flabelliformis TaxID=2512241 RepID=A0A553I994_9PEZI|nr:hypothetical protein FHL15_002439 [Xylaria flabelliformis]